jgi:hypothetical protein
LGTIGDKHGAVKSVILRTTASFSENLNAHNRLYLRAYYAYSRITTKRKPLASNPTPSAIYILGNEISGFMHSLAFLNPKS